MDENEDNIEFIIQLGYTHLWGKDTLYHRYNIVSNFYESICNILLLSLLFFSLAAIEPVIEKICDKQVDVGYRTYWTDALNESLISLVFLALILSFYILCLIQFTKFEKRRAYQFVIEVINSGTEESNRIGPAS